MATDTPKSVNKGGLMGQVSLNSRGNTRTDTCSGYTSQRLTGGRGWEKVLEKRQRERGPSYPVHNFTDEMANAGSSRALVI